MTGVILFRAQPFHNGHLAQIKKAFSDIRKIDGHLYIFVGSADKFGTKRNPIPIEMRLNLILNTLEEEFSYKQRQYIHVIALNDLSDEANNTWSWGEYLYENISQITKDSDFIFYYSDKPEIALSWFDPENARQHICFKFLNRVDNLNATKVRENLKNFNLIELEKMLPPAVFCHAEELCDYINKAR